MIQHCMCSISILVALIGSLLSAPWAYAQSKPVVVSTTPADQAVGVSAYLESYSITFSKPMNTQYGAIFTNNYPATSAAWSPDGTVLTFTRTVPPTPLEAGKTFTFYLNLPGLEPDYMYRDTGGNLLDYYSFSFTVEGGFSGLHKINADPQKGFSWDYYLYVPQTLKSPTILFVQPNNTGADNDDIAVHDDSAKSLIQSTKAWADSLGSPYLIPVFPRPAALEVGYTHALDRAALLSTEPGYERLDLQLIAMIENAQSILSSYDVNVEEKVFLTGISASGSFVSRFTMLHPDRVRAASIGAPGYGPIVPVPSWNGLNLPYPEGISDLENLVGSSFDATNFQNVPMQLYVGDEDDNIVSWWDPSDPTVARIIAAFGGKLLYSRWPRYESAYCSVTTLAQFVVFPGKGHEWPKWSYMQEFFENNRNSPHPPLQKPLQYKIYFPQVASFLSWETEIALVNTIPGGVSIKGELQGFSAMGGAPLESIQVEIPPGGRKEITVGKSYQRPADIAYIAFLSDSGFLAGYTRFNQPGNRVSLPAKSGVLEGWFPKMEQDGYTGLAFVNTGDREATVILVAYDENGGKVEEQNLPVPAGGKVVGLTDQVFHSDISNARFFSFTSDQKVVAFTVSGSGDGQMLDGLPALERYTR